MEFLLMALGHNFRKLAAKGGFSSGLPFKLMNKSQKFNFTIEIYYFQTSKYFTAEIFKQNLNDYKMAA